MTKPTMATSVRKIRIGDVLIQRELITQEDLRKALVVQRSRGQPLGETLVELGMLSADALRDVLSQLLGLPAVDLDRIYGDPSILGEISKEKAYELEAIPLFLVDNQLTVALPDPNDLNKVDTLAFLTGRKILPVFALGSDIKKHLREYYGEADSQSDELVFETSSIERRSAQQIEVDVDEEERPVVRLVNMILSRAIQEEASDIHLEPEAEHMGVRFRIDGRLHSKPFRLPANAISSVVSRLKILSQMDISERRIPQDGKVGIRYRGRQIDVRASTYPTIHGEKVVLRLLDKERQSFTLSSIGMSSHVHDIWLRLLRRREGILLVTGPTGSGKSSTLFATLRHLNQPDINIVTLEDPVEYQLPGVTQGQVNDRAGFTFARGLRSILRQDPDIILVGEIRDLETAQIAVQAALTGHLVLATLHTNDAPSSINRLIDMGVARFLLASSLIGVLAQRLVRRLCPECRLEVECTEEERLRLWPWLQDDLPFLDGAGCDRCLEIGYKGRIGVHELLTVNRDIQELILAEASVAALASAGRSSGYATLWYDGLTKVSSGLTSLRELARSITPSEEEVNTLEGDPRGDQSQSSDSPS